MTLALALGIMSVDAQTKDYVDYERGYRASMNNVHLRVGYTF